MADIINRLNVGQTVNVKLTDSAVTNGQNLVDAYNYAKTLTPNGAALSATNRVSVIIQPGNYTLAAELAVNTQFVDLIGMGAIKLERGAIPAVIIGGNTLNVTANDVRVQGISVGTQEFKSGDSLPLQRFEDCTGGDNSFGYSVVVSGTFTNCTGGEFTFGGVGGTANGTFTNCTGGSESFGGGNGGTASGPFTNCTGGEGAFGGSGGTANGTFTNCTGGEFTFGGAGGTANGTFTNCTGTVFAFGGDSGVASGKFYQCRLIGDTFQTVTGAGLMRECIDGNNNIVDQ